MEVGHRWRSGIEGGPGRARGPGTIGGVGGAAQPRWVRRRTEVGCVARRKLIREAVLTPRGAGVVALRLHPPYAVGRCGEGRRRRLRRRGTGRRARRAAARGWSPRRGAPGGGRPRPAEHPGRSRSSGSNSDALCSDLASRPANGSSSLVAGGRRASDGPAVVVHSQCKAFLTTGAPRAAYRAVAPVLSL